MFKHINHQLVRYYFSLYLDPLMLANQMIGLQIQIVV